MRIVPAAGLFALDFLSGPSLHSFLAPAEAAPPSTGIDEDSFAMTHPEPPQSNRLRVLIVEDNADAASSTKMVLELDGHEVYVARDGLAALEAAAAIDPDAILLDIGLPRMSGYEVAERLKSRKAERRLLLIAVTGYATEGDREKSAAAGIDVHLLKPNDPKFLLALLRRFAKHQDLATDEQEA
jgi:CheY-like chemotaxis protein